MATRGSISRLRAKVIAVYEDWKGGAGNGLGTLYAYTEEVKVCTALYGINIPALFAAGSISIALYHTAGKRTRLSPLPGSENNNKSGVKLPTMLKLKKKYVPMTILEAVVKQTGVYASSRRGRLSVFWGDQVFIPSAKVKYEAKTSGKTGLLTPPIRLRNSALENALVRMEEHGCSDDYSTKYLNSFHDLGLMEVPPGHILNTPNVITWFHKIKELNAIYTRRGVDPMSVPHFLQVILTHEQLLKLIKGANRENELTKVVTYRRVEGLLQKWKETNAIPLVVKKKYPEFLAAYSMYISGRG
ncbi:hypothetical protein PsorP6_010464 [Peronosclerospora sorghi]|uniref:Uncharacterized protein n=1 Tax=Peronosclerospora sorghi TaxID=230839 RepID=A0ACC0VXD9_9STRA|nr:hypothetical protein PsorP6_010464 [Peronosclerospora sorghi]